MKYKDDIVIRRMIRAEEYGQRIQPAEYPLTTGQEFDEQIESKTSVTRVFLYNHVRKEQN